MENRKYDPQFESLKDFWNAQQERLSLLSGMKITDDAVNVTAAFGESEIMIFEKLMQTQKQLAEMMVQSPVVPTVSAAAPLVKRISNPVIDNLDLSDPKTVRRFEIHPYECDGGVRGESLRLSGLHFQRRLDLPRQKLPRGAGRLFRRPESHPAHQRHRPVLQPALRG